MSKSSEIFRGGVKRWVLQFTPKPAKTVSELLDTQRTAVAMLEAMVMDGVALEMRGDQIYLITTDPEVARFYRMHEETEFLDDVAKESA